MNAISASRRVLLGVDDTDNLESRGTGHRARQIARGLMDAGLATVHGVSRHQLYVHPDIPYTSHNSALCLDLDWYGGALGELADFVRFDLEQHAAPGSDAGFCIAPYDSVGAEVESFGTSAKSTVLNKAAARALAERCGYHLEGVTGDHGGIIGSIACVGLRHTGHDGRFVWVKGVRDLDGITTAGFLLQETGIDLLHSVTGGVIRNEDRIDVAPWPRPVLLDHKAVLLIETVGEDNASCQWKIVPRERTKQY